MDSAAPHRPHPQPGLRLQRVPFTDPDAQRLVAQVQQEYVARYGGPDNTPSQRRPGGPASPASY